MKKVWGAFQRLRVKWKCFENHIWFASRKIISAFGEDVSSSGQETAAETCSLPPYASSALPLAAFCSLLSAIVSDQRLIAHIVDHAWLVASGRRPSDPLWQTRSWTLTCWLGNIKWIRQHSIFVPSKHYVTSHDTFKFLQSKSFELCVAEDK